MSDLFRFPLFQANRQLGERDMTRMSAAIEALVAHIVQNLLVDPTVDGPNGIVLWGLEVSDASSVGNPRRFSVSAGAAVVPAAAGTRRWQMCILPNAVTQDLAAGDTRRDLVELRLADVAEENEVRKFRVVAG